MVVKKILKKSLDIKSHYLRAKAFYIKYERVLMPATLVVGFLVDYITFTSIQISITFSILLLYWLATGATIIFINLYDAGKLPQRFRYVRLFSPLVLQFTFGALLSSSLIFYWFSGAFSISWPLILIVAGVMISNDVFRHYFLHPAMQISVYFSTTISLFSVVLPFLSNSLSPWLFAAAGGLSTVLFAGFIAFLSKMHEAIHRQKKMLFAWVFFILIAMNMLYFTNIIPLIPLALREAGLYHSLKVSGGSYLLGGEPETFWEHIIPGQTLHVLPAQRVYFYTAVFAPSTLRTAIVHHWQYYDETHKEWASKDKLSFDIIGGRREGYKGYSFESNLAPGRWRILVENPRGQVLGIMRFNIEYTEGKLILEETKR